MFFSVIVPVHNVQKHIREALDSALSMDTSFYEGPKEDLYEIIVVENGSSDETPGICDEYAARHEELSVIHKGKIGLYAARQTGIREACGDWIIALDGDDIVSEKLLFELYRFISGMEKTESKADIIYYDAADTKNRYKAMTGHPFESGRVYKGDDKKLFYDLICRGDSLNSMWSKCIRKSIAYLGRENMYLNYGEDLYQTAEYADMAEGIAYIGKILYYYRCEEGITASYNTLFLDNQKIVWK
ncbi:MAG: glycosyltransferase, partial [Oribacterium sp.]|nr:glycosyltransferase [Oribacterium sp.]